MQLRHLGTGLRVTILAASLATPAAAQGPALGDFEGHGDVGAPKRAGSALYDAAKQEYTLSASGVNMWGQRDELHFAWRRMKGDFIVQARLRFEGKGADPHRKAGVIVRASLEADAPYADAAVHGDGLTSLQFRRGNGAVTEEVALGDHGRRGGAARAQGQPDHDVGRPLRRPLHHQRGEGPRARRRGVRRPLRLRPQPRGGGDGGVRRRAADRARARQLPCRIATTSAAGSSCSTCRPARAS